MNRLRLAALAAVAITVLAACGTAASGPSGPDAAPEPVTAVASASQAPQEQPTPAQAPTVTRLPSVSPDSLIPLVDTVDVRTGNTVNLGSVVPSDKPVLLWAWAPHCPSCRAEAGDLEKFAANHQDRLTVVGIGTQDDLDYARSFLEDTGVTTPLMLWDESFESWRAIGITAQPTWILVRGDGSFIDGWIGALPEDRILELLDA